MRTPLRRVATRVLLRPFLRNRLLASNRGHVSIFMYHGFTKNHGTSGLTNREGMHLQVNRFEEQVQHLAQNHPIVPLQLLVKASRGEAELPANAAVLTIDDGYETNYTLAFPVLQRFRTPATIFITTSFVEERMPLWYDRVEWALNGAPERRWVLQADEEPIHLDLRDDASRQRTARQLLAHLKRLPPDSREGIVQSLETEIGRRLRFPSDEAPEIYRPLTWAQIARMIESGLVTIGNHTHSHPVLPYCTESRSDQEIAGAHEIIEKRLRIPCRMFAYPDGQPSASSKATLAALGYEVAVGTRPQLWRPEMDLLDLPRFAVGPGATLEEFALLAFGGSRVALGTLGTSFLPSRGRRQTPTVERRDANGAATGTIHSGTRQDRSA